MSGAAHTAVTDPGWENSTTPSRVRHWTNRPPAVALIALFVYGAYAAIVIVRHGVQSFALVAPKWLLQSHASPTIDRYAHVSSPTGYDGQFYLFEALDPSEEHGITRIRRSTGTRTSSTRCSRERSSGASRARSRTPWSQSTSLRLQREPPSSRAIWHGTGTPRGSRQLYFLFPGVYRPFTFDLCEPLRLRPRCGRALARNRNTSGRPGAPPQQ